MQRVAQCSCGSVSISVLGTPVSVVACHCKECQRRTGSILGVGAYYSEESVSVAGETTQFARLTDAGNEFSSNFCSTCGTSIYWRTSKNPELIGIAVGAFADPWFPLPVRSVWEQSMHPWLHIPAQQHFSRGRSD